MSALQLQLLVARAAKEDFKTKPKWQRDQRKEELRAQLFWYGIEHTDRMLLPTLEKLLRQAVEANNVSTSTQTPLLPLSLSS